VDECIDCYIRLSKRVFDLDDVLNGSIPKGDVRGRFDYKVLENALKEILKTKLKDENAIMEDRSDQRCPTFVVATNGLHAGGPAVLFRSYRCRGSDASRSLIWQAARATTAAPAFFREVFIDIPSPGSWYVASGVGNPSELALDEAKKLRPTVTRYCVISVGTGHQTSTVPISIPSALSQKDERPGVLWSKSQVEDSAKLIKLAHGFLSYRAIAEACVAYSINSDKVNENMMNVARSAKGGPGLYLYRFNVDQDLGQLGLCEWEKAAEIEDYAKSYMMQVQVKRDRCVSNLWSYGTNEGTWFLYRVLMVGLYPTSQEEKHFLVPYARNPQFSGREESLNRLWTVLGDEVPNGHNHQIALCGMGGVGKTQIAVEYVYRHKDYYHGTFWISATNQHSLLSRFQEIAAVTGCVNVETLPPRRLAKEVISWLRKRPKSLIVFDNLDDPSVIDSLLPLTVLPSHVLFITRESALPFVLTERLEVTALLTSEAVDLFARQLHHQLGFESQEDLEQATRIVTELENSPLAIVQASGYIGAASKKLSHFLQVYQEVRNEISDPHHWRYSPSVATTWRLSFQTIQAEFPNAAKLLQLLAFLDPNAVSIDFLSMGSRGDMALGKLMQNQSVFQESLSVLERFFCVEWDVQHKSIIISRVLQAVIQDAMPSSLVMEMWKMVISCCVGAFPLGNARLDRSRCRSYEDQVFVPLLNVPTMDSEPLVRILINVGNLLGVDDKIEEAELILTKAISHATELLGYEHPLVKTAVNSLVMVNLKPQGEMETTDGLIEPIAGLTGEERHGDFPSPITGSRDMELRSTEFDERVLQTAEKILGDAHPWTLYSLENLAETYFEQGRFTAAARLYERVVDVKQRHLGEQHPSTITSLGDLALTYCSLGRLSEAAKLQEKVVEANRDVLGEEHPSTVMSISNLALIYVDQGHIAAAKVLQLKEFNVNKSILGEEHPTTMASIENLIQTYTRCGEFEQAAHMQEQLLAVQRKVSESTK
jgi:NB-ARC domain/Tetratricopeptide repeat